MHINLNTTMVWELNRGGQAGALFRSLPIICSPQDIMVVGSYRASEEIRSYLIANEITLSKDKPFVDWFDLNRDKYPDGKAYAFLIAQNYIDKLAEFSALEDGGVDKRLFFEHILVYRPGKPVLPLLNYHDAYSGGAFYLSGHYEKKVIEAFAISLMSEFRMIENPEAK